jgi:hypothetical protein
MINNNEKRQPQELCPGHARLQSNFTHNQITAGSANSHIEMEFFSAEKQRRTSLSGARTSTAAGEGAAIVFLSTTRS